MCVPALNKNNHSSCATGDLYSPKFISYTGADNCAGIDTTTANPPNAASVNNIIVSNPLPEERRRKRERGGGL